jgi:hypothetical protein
MLPAELYWHGKSDLCALDGQTEISRFTRAGAGNDPAAFVILRDTNELLGDGFEFHVLAQ